MTKSVDFEAFLDSLPVTQAIAQIDEEIQKHRAAIIHLQHRRNSLVPIARLPPEVLSAIFLFNVLDGRSTFEYWFEPRRFRESYCWINITYVCHYWREVTLNDPKLWSFWGDMTSRWSKEFNSRSKAAPLHLRLTDPSLTSSDHIFEDPDVLDRIHELHVDIAIDTGSMSALVGHLNDYSASMNSSERALAIRSLRIRYPSHGRLHSLSCKLPQLLRLELEGCLFGWNSPIFISSNLTHLKICDFETNTTLLELLSILEKQPRLENLDLGFDTRDPPPSGVVTNVHIPRLREFRLSGPSCFDLATHISYPSTSTLVNFNVWGPKSTGPAPVLDSDSRILGFLSRHYGRGEIADSSGNIEPPTIRRLSFKVDYDLYEVDLWLNTGLGDPSSLLPLCHIEIQGRPPSESTFQAMSKDICEVLPLTHLYRLDVAGLDMMSKGWLEVLGVMDELEELKIQGEDTVVAAINALRPNQAPRHPVPLPNLHRLHIVDFDCRVSRVSSSDFPSCLEARKRVHRGLSLLVLRRCTLSSSMVETYIRNGIAAVVDWDGDPEFNKDGYSSSDEEYYSDSSIGCECHQ